MPKKKIEATPKQATGQMKKEAVPKQATGQMKKEATPKQATSTSNGMNRYNKLQKAATQGAVTGGAGQMKRQATPLTPAQRSSGGAGGRVSGTQRTRDPFLAGFNSDLDGTRERPTGGRRRK